MVACSHEIPDGSTTGDATTSVEAPANTLRDNGIQDRSDPGAARSCNSPAKNCHPSTGPAKMDEQWLAPEKERARIMSGKGTLIV